ncbi:alpha/beta hydrolase [Kribbella sp. NPDC056861]|uniref:alpha/beta hydrolase n=1 Tax=Kribbella sp. NPDC056861 TaxID=3154857 RepID=UPI003446858E
MRKLSSTTAALLLLAATASSVSITPVAAAKPALKFGTCPDDAATSAAASCATLKVPLDYAKPQGRQITLTISVDGNLNAERFMLVNPGGPGAPGLGMESSIYEGLPPAMAKKFAVFGFDPRGIGASTPVNCGDTSKFAKHPAPPARPENAVQENQRVQQARQIALACGAHSKELLPHITTENAARDLDRIRIALGRDKIDYLGYSYGTLLGATYATLFPAHVGRFVLNSVMDPALTTYRANFTQDLALQQRIDQMFSWAAARDNTYHLGRTRIAVEAVWKDLLKKAKAHPIGGVAGAAELGEAIIGPTYSADSWPDFVAAMAQYRRGDGDPMLLAVNEATAVPVDPGNLAYNCMDVGWPRDWRVWHRDTLLANAKAPLVAWGNTWFVAPCAFWPVMPVPAQRIGSVKVPPMLLIEPEYDGATPLAGARRMHDALTGSRLLIQAGGDHASYLSNPDPCIDTRAERFWLTGELPANHTCAWVPTP